MKTNIDIVPASLLLELPRPIEHLICPDTRKASYKRRKSALESVLTGMSVNNASKRHHVSRACLTRMRNQATEIAADGKPHGFRVCLPGYRCDPPVPLVVADVPVKAGPHAFGRLLKQHTRLGALLDGYRGPLPRHNAPSPKFDRLFKSFRTAVATEIPKGGYPLDGKDKGRRAVIEYLKRRSRDAQCTTGSEEPRETYAGRFASLFGIGPLDRIETDGHPIDVEWRLRVTANVSGDVIVEISRLWILATIDSVSLVVYSVVLVLATEYNQFHFLEVHANILTPWSPRQLRVEGLQYRPDSWMPSAVERAEDICRPNCESIDNAMSQRSKFSVANVTQSFLGVMNHGPAHVPEERCHIESFNKRLEEYLLRKFPGGYRPDNSERGAQKTTTMDPADYPLDPEAIRDCLDAFISADNAEPRVSLQNRSPRDVHLAHIASGAWVTRSSLTEHHARQMMSITCRVTLRGSRKNRKQPHVDWLYGTYRSPKLQGRWDLIGKRFDAIVDLRDVRTLTLLDTATHAPYVVLTVASPWTATAQSYELRQKVHAWRSRDRAHHEIGDDIVSAYLAHMRALARKDRTAAYRHLAHDLDIPRSTPMTETTSQPPDTPMPLHPRKRVNLFGDKR